MPVLSNYVVYENATSEEQASMDECYSLAQSIHLDDRTNQTCLPVEFSVMAELYNGAVGMY